MTTSSDNTNLQKPSSIKNSSRCFEFSRSKVPDLREMDNYLFVEYNGQRHLHPQRVSSAKRGNVSSLKITYFTPNHMSYLRDNSSNLNMLDLSGCKLFKIPPEIISGMTHLQILILDDNELEDNSFCKEFSHNLGNVLKEISLTNNNLTTLFPKVEDFSKLLRMKISKNKISNLNGIEKLKRLKLFSVQENELMQLCPGFYRCKRLENAYFSSNKIVSVSVLIKNMVNLRELDLSYNVIQTIPGELFSLPNIEIIKLNNNKIIKIPKFKITARLNNPITFVDLSHNNIVTFPECVIRIVEELELSNNKIKIIPASVLKKLCYQSTQRMHLFNNPIIDPPKDICESGLKSMVQYAMEFEVISKKYYGIKIFCLGEEKSEKNKVINYLTDNGEDDNIKGETLELLDIIESNSRSLNTSSNVIPSFNIKFFNMSEERKEFDILNYFLTSPALNLIFIGIDNWTEDLFHNFLEYWLLTLLSKYKDVTFLLVGLTKQTIDGVSLEKCEFIREKVKSLFKGFKKRISKEIEKIESREKITAAMSHSLKRLIHLTSMKVTFDIICVNMKNSKSLKNLSTEILKLTTDQNIFINALTTVPSFWNDLQTYIEEESYQFPIISFSEFENILQRKFNLKSSSKNVAKYLQDIGSILWFQEVSPLNQWIIASPESIVECCRLLFRRDLSTYLLDSNDPDKNRKRFKSYFPNSRLTYSVVCEVLLNSAILLPELSISLLENIIPKQSILKMLHYLCKCWNLGYIVDYSGYYTRDWSHIYEEIKDDRSEITNSVFSHENRQKSAESTRSFESKRSQLSIITGIPPIFLTLLNYKTDGPHNIYNKVDERNNLEITIRYCFPMGYPTLIFDQATSRANDINVDNILSIEHWISGIQVQFKDQPIFFKLEKLKDKDNTIQYLFVYDSSNLSPNSNDKEEFQASELWKYMQPILNDMDDLLNSYIGLWFERLIQCPYCKDFSFLGTWHSLNENDSLECQICSSCDGNVPLYHLEPSKIMKNVTSEEIIKNIRKQFCRN